ncbi:disA bacterial checkpoint controller nucleotide-binding domain-containing protein [Ditylenchus destructor]|nr:disA bacterial checkpoint controller nucleotide-binding domain-containing protein [Ditylenchus destructor]
MSWGRLYLCVPNLGDALRKANEYNLLYDADDATESDWLDKFITDFIDAVYRIERLKIGALIVIQHKEALNLEDLCQTDGTIMDGRFAPKILESIFSKDTPLHDGAVVIRIAQGVARIYAANVIIPNLSSRNTPGLSPDMNTRHRSAMAFNDMSNSTFVVVVSEKEHVAVVRNGEIQQNVNQDSMSALLKNHLNPFFPISQSAPEQIMSPSTSGTTNEMVNGDQSV